MQELELEQKGLQMSRRGSLSGTLFSICASLLHAYDS